MTSVSKTFPGTRALSSASLEIAGGEIHALVGGNGSGKSTLIKILAGVQPADPGGRIQVGESSIAADQVTPDWSLSVNLAFVHQDLGLFEHLSVAENLFVGLPYPRRAGQIDWCAMKREAAGMLDRLGVSARPEAPLAALRPADRTLVAIGRALRGRDDVHAGALVLDEPTARLHALEVDRLLEALRRLAHQGQSILYVSHRLDEVLALAHRVTVLRDGEVVAVRRIADLSPRELGRLIAGRDVRLHHADEDAGESGETVLEVRDLRAGPLAGVDLSIRAGEIVGLTGLVGSGRSSFLRAIYGAQPREGTVMLGGRRLPHDDVAAAVRAGVGLVPEDRLRQGAFLTLDVRENLSASHLNRFRRGLRWFDRRAEVATSRKLFDDFGVRCRSLQTPMALLSGGNQQKVILARWLAGEPRLLLLDEPTQGVDVGARADIYHEVREAARRGCAVLVASSDEDEVLELADRIIVLRGGRIAASASRADADRHWLAQEVFGRDYLEEDANDH